MIKWEAEITMCRVLAEKLIIPQLVKEFPHFVETKNSLPRSKELVQSHKIHCIYTHSFFFFKIFFNICHLCVESVVIEWHGKARCGGGLPYHSSAFTTQLNINTFLL